MSSITSGINRFCTAPRLLVVILVAAVGPATNLLAQDDARQPRNSTSEQEKAAVAHVEDVWLNALNHADIKAIDEVLADDFVRPAPDSGDFVTKADLLAFYRSHLSPQGADQRRIEDMTVTVYGSTALARGVLTTTNPKGEVIRKLLFTDVFVQRNGKWLAVSAQENVVSKPLAAAH